jgi:hypothetical protein
MRSCRTNRKALITDSPGADDGERGDRFVAVLGEGLGLQDGLSEEWHQPVATPFRGALHLDDIRVLAALNQQIGAKVTGRRPASDLPSLD